MEVMNAQKAITVLKEQPKILSKSAQSAHSEERQEVNRLMTVRFALTIVLKIARAAKFASFVVVAQNLQKIDQLAIVLVHSEHGKRSPTLVSVRQATSLQSSLS